MTTKCYIIDWSPDNEVLLGDLIAAKFDYSIRVIDDDLFELSVTADDARIRDLEDVVKWYV
jgi:hypothetical protein